MKTKEPIHLRKRVTKTGLVSLYLDVYANGKRTYEYLKLYLVPEKSRKEKEQNRQTMELAEAIKAKRIVELRNGQFGFESTNNNEKANFYDYFVEKCKEKKDKNWYSCLKNLEAYDGKLQNRTFAEIDTNYIKGFKQYLEKEAKSRNRKEENETNLSQNTKALYFTKFKACIHSATKEEILLKDPLKNIEGFKQEDSTRMYLTLEEVKKLVETPCGNDAVRRAFLFSCLTGLRRSDIEKLTWGEIYQQGAFTRIIFKQKKTRGLEYLDITQEAVRLMGDKGKDTDFVFKGLSNESGTNYAIRKWCKDAGIEKHISFHCARHTFATMMLDLGTDLYTVSKLLGHRKVETTQIYAKVLDKNKQEAVLRIPSILKGDVEEKD